MNEKPASICDLALDVLSGACTEEERLAFERHLPGCEACQAEMDDLQLVWEGLYADMESIGPPADLKQQVIKAALDAEPAARAAQPATRASRREAAKPRWRRIIPAAALLAVFLGGSAWNFWLYRERTSAPPQVAALPVSAAQVKLAVPLQAESRAPAKAYGIACIVDNGRSKQFVVYVYGAAATKGDQAYQVWLVKDGVRSSAGTFRVAAEGIGVGVLTMPLESDALPFDRIGITLEPDDQGDQPRGEKMFGSA
ncbi:anti-sigma factor [Paenibacillus filicis]|uniref:Regulator of SigK n=1 Tax=Paenibacillus filicis TaxID=669464 RepID=A0ABU9DJY7_9BACL